MSCIPVGWSDMPGLVSPGPLHGTECQRLTGVSALRHRCPGASGRYPAGKGVPLARFQGRSRGDEMGVRLAGAGTPGPNPAHDGHTRCREYCRLYAP